MKPKPRKKKGETLDRICGVLHVFQAESGYRFGEEALQLAAFLKPGASHLVDLGTGCGIIPMVAVSFHGVERAIGLEIQRQLADRARRSVRYNGLEKRVEIVQADLRNLKGILPESAFDLVTANPPYRPVGSGHISAGDERARCRHEILCTLSQVIEAASSLLRPRGRLALVLPAGRLPEAFAACREKGLTPSRLRMIHGRIDLPSRNCLVEAIHFGQAALTVDPPLVMRNKSGDYSEEAKAILYPSV